MKTNLLFIRNLTLVIFAGIILSSCKKDETSSNDIVGTWTSGTATYTATVGDKSLNQYLMDDLGLTTFEAQAYEAAFNQFTQQSLAGSIELKKDGSYTSTLGGSNDSGTWSLSDNGKTLTIDSDTDAPLTFNVVSLTSDKLHVTYTETQSEDLNEDGTPETVTIDIDLTFNKA